MSWLRRFRRAPPGEASPEETGEPAPAAVERAAPGFAALFDGVSEDRTHAVLDLGSAAESSFSFYSRYARRIRFAGLLSVPSHEETGAAALRALPPDPDQPYDLVLGWNILDRLNRQERLSFVERLTEITSPDARLYVVVDASGESRVHPLHFAVVDLDRISQQVAGPPERARPQLLPAEVERLLRPFQVMHAFTLRLGLREYVAVKGGRPQWG